MVFCSLEDSYQNFDKHFAGRENREGCHSGNALDSHSEVVPGSNLGHDTGVLKHLVVFFSLSSQMPGWYLN